MEYIVDIYIKVVIAVFGFIAPSVTLLMPVLSGKISEIRRNINEQQKVIRRIKEQLNSEYLKSLNSFPNSELKTKLLQAVNNHSDKRTEPFTEKLNKLTNDFKKLNLKRTIKYIFGFIILSLLLIMIGNIFTPKFDYSAKDLLLEDKIIASCFLLVSCILFVLALIKIWSSVCIVVDHNIVSSEKSDITSDSILEEKSTDLKDNISIEVK